MYHDDVRNIRFPDSYEILILELPKVGLATGLLADWLRFVYAKKEEDFMQAAAKSADQQGLWCYQGIKPG